MDGGRSIEWIRCADHCYRIEIPFSCIKTIDCSAECGKMVLGLWKRPRCWRQVRVAGDNSDGPAAAAASEKVWVRCPDFSQGAQIDQGQTHEIWIDKPKPAFTALWQLLGPNKFISIPEDPLFELEAAEGGGRCELPQPAQTSPLRAAAGGNFQSLAPPATPVLFSHSPSSGQIHRTLSSLDHAQSAYLNGSSPSLPSPCPNHHALPSYEPTEHLPQPNNVPSTNPLVRLYHHDADIYGLDHFNYATISPRTLLPHAQDASTIRI
jgi:hypothetical protein